MSVMTTLCYIEKDNKYLMLHRVKKKNDVNQDKWVGIGGKFEENETPEECLIREAFEETGLKLVDYKLRGVITFISDNWETEYMYLFTCSKFEGEVEKNDGTFIECNEGNLEWIDKKEVYNLPIWEGDKIFFKLLETEDGFFTLKLRYEGDKLVESQVKKY